MPNMDFVDCISQLTPTVCKLMGVAPPAQSTGPPLRRVVEAAEVALGKAPLERCLIFAPDAIGAHLWDCGAVDFQPLLGEAPCKAPLRSVVPPKTPVCFASMFTGAPPEVHGIRHYERPVLRCPTLFDALIAAGKRVAVVAVKDSSIDLIFRERRMDYLSETYDQEVLDRALELLRANRHDLIVAYQQEYDDTLHRTTPLSPECLRAARRHVADFFTLVRAAREHWQDLRSARIFAPDHGAHVDPATGHGDHGDDIAVDMHLFHCYGWSGLGK